VTTSNFQADRPHDVYKREMRARVMSLSPHSLLDVGCGSGQLLRAAELSACSRRVGLEPDRQLLEQLQSQGLETCYGRAEALPFQDRTFDVVVFEYVAHHLEDLARSLAEAARVARRGVVVLDPWYDITLPSQRNAEAFDLWCKAIDREAGDIHNPCPSVAQIAAAFQARPVFKIDYAKRLILQHVPITRVEAIARVQLERIGGSAGALAQLARIRKQVQAEGMTEDGALCLTAIKE
jgi:SAM-dependent methyltransferase